MVSIGSRVITKSEQIAYQQEHTLPESVKNEEIGVERSTEQQFNNEMNSLARQRADAATRLDESNKENDKMEKANNDQYAAEQQHDHDDEQAKKKYDDEQKRINELRRTAKETHDAEQKRIGEQQDILVERYHNAIEDMINNLMADFVTVKDVFQEFKTPKVPMQAGK